MHKTLLLTMAFFVLWAVHAGAQSSGAHKEELLKHIQADSIKRIEAKKGPRFQHSANPLKMVLFMPLFAYQLLISEQISAHCEFEPSCSSFCIQSIKQLGVIKGLFLSADRLMRCNGQAQRESKEYLFDHRRGKVIDEPYMYKIKE